MFANKGMPKSQAPVKERMFDGLGRIGKSVYVDKQVFPFWLPLALVDKNKKSFGYSMSGASSRIHGLFLSSRAGIGRNGRFIVVA